MSKRALRATAADVLTLVELVKLGAGRSFASISSKKLGESLGVSQQAASFRLAKLEKKGLARRAHSGRGLAVQLTESGMRAAGAFYTGLRGALEKTWTRMEFQGTVFTGLGEGGYYVSLKGYAKPFFEALGFEPYPGTLNLKLAGEAMIEQRRWLDHLKGVEVAGFKDETRSYGPVKCFRALIASKAPGAVLAIARTHYDDSVLEVISPFNLRQKLGLSDGDECSVTAYFEQDEGTRERHARSDSLI